MPSEKSVATLHTSSVLISFVTYTNTHNRFKRNIPTDVGTHSHHLSSFYICK